MAPVNWIYSNMHDKLDNTFTILYSENYSVIKTAKSSLLSALVHKLMWGIVLMASSCQSIKHVY